MSENFHDGLYLTEKNVTLFFKITAFLWQLLMLNRNEEYKPISIKGLNLDIYNAFKLSNTSKLRFWPGFPLLFFMGKKLFSHWF